MVVNGRWVPNTYVFEFVNCDISSVAVLELVNVQFGLCLLFLQGKEEMSVAG